MEKYKEADVITQLKDVLENFKTCAIAVPEDKPEGMEMMGMEMMGMEMMEPAPMEMEGGEVSDN